MIFFAPNALTNTEIAPAGSIDVEKGISVKGCEPVAHVTDPVNAIPDFVADSEGVLQELPSTASYT